MKKLLFTSAWGVAVWGVATLFFVIFGEHVLFSPGTSSYILSTIFLLVGTGVLLWLVTYFYLFFDKSKNAALRFGIVGTITGLILDTFSLSNYQFLFPELKETQVISFTSWMAFAYALFLIIPGLMNMKGEKSDEF